MLVFVQNEYFCFTNSKLKMNSSDTVLVIGACGQIGSELSLALRQIYKNVIATDFSGTKEASQLAINEIGEVNIKLSKAIYFDTYNDNKSNGAFILIDAATNTTAGVGFIR